MNEVDKEVMTTQCKANMLPLCDSDWNLSEEKGVKSAELVYLTKKFEIFG